MQNGKAIRRAMNLVKCSKCGAQGHRTADCPVGKDGRPRKVGPGGK